ncbi:TetR/AcrR family transcriptional regulator [Pseudodesulfovibrio piezophilus]|uniref:HTH tetR-type domain-containing protein n=1 Tax=Pseudodesulfovibrio piezophilus (strain DSM 21447 / JCM 15486 / C1TLV30) TaxID=1322246 RepID=M1WME4_PSEP2|nr:TetR/AcrR family transcriptional regulator [Pseudodesulfovibrio piezophilus]CCH49460.1 protein of unknown function [Pseudodesulfovibrio piezophilus C1TLV30]
MTKDMTPKAIREAVIKAATQCFAEKGIKRTTYARLGEVSGVDPVAIKVLFGSKDLLAMTVQSHELEKLKSDYLTHVPDAQADETIKFIICHRLEFLAQNRDRSVLLIKNALAARQPWASMLDHILWELSIEFASILEKGVREGSLRRDSNVTTAVRAITSFYMTGLVVIGFKAAQFDPQVVWEFIEPQLKLVLDSLRA